MATFVRLNPEAFREFLTYPQGATGRELFRRGVRVQTRAKQLCPVDTGRLRASITVATGLEGGELVIRVGTNVKYARFIHNGTGIYGPARKRITPKSGQVLVFTPRGATKPVFARSVRGVKRHEFLKDAIGAAL